VWNVKYVTWWRGVGERADEVKDDHVRMKMYGESDI